MAELIPDEVFARLTRPQIETFVEALIDIVDVADGLRPEFGRPQIESLVELLRALAAFDDGADAEFADLIEVLLGQLDPVDDPAPRHPAGAIGGPWVPRENRTFAGRTLWTASDPKQTLFALAPGSLLSELARADRSMIALGTRSNAD